MKDFEAIYRGISEDVEFIDWTEATAAVIEKSPPDLVRTLAEQLTDDARIADAFDATIRARPSKKRRDWYSSLRRIVAAFPPVQRAALQKDPRLAVLFPNELR